MIFGFEVENGCIESDVYQTDFFFSVQQKPAYLLQSLADIQHLC